MTPTEALERILPRWRSSLPPELAPEVDAFVGRRRPALEKILGQVLGVRRLQRGELPRTVEDFSAAGLLAERERPHHGAPDRDVVLRLKKRTTARLAGIEDPEARDSVRSVIPEYVLFRAEALLLGQMGWDAVPLLLRQPMLAIFSAKSVVLVHRHGADADDAIFPGFEDASVADLRADVETAHRVAIEIRAQVDERGGGPEAIWARARGRAAARRRQEKARPRAEQREDLDAEEWFEAGELPRTIAELAAYRRFAERGRPDEDQDDEALLTWIAARRDALMGRRPDIDTQEAAITAEYDFIRLRAEAIVLRALGHQAIPMMLKRPSLTVTIGDEALVHRHFPPELALGSGGDLTLYDYFAGAPSTIDIVRVLREVHLHVERLRVEIGGMDMDVVAPALWQAARDLAATVKTSEPDADEREALDALLAPEPVDRFGRMIHETRWASRAAAIRQLERAGFRFIKTRAATAAGWPEGYWSRFPRTAVIKGATVQVTAAP